MPKVYMTARERNKAKLERQSRQENAVIGAEIRSAMKTNGVLYPDLCREADVSNGTVSKAIHNPQNLKIETLRKICFAAGLRLVIDCEPI